MDQMDVIKRFVAKYSSVFLFSTTSEDMENAVKENKVFILTCLKGGTFCLLMAQVK